MYGGIDESKFGACLTVDKSEGVEFYPYDCLVEKRVWMTELKNKTVGNGEKATLIVYADDGYGKATRPLSAETLTF